MGAVTSRLATGSIGVIHACIVPLYVYIGYGFFGVKNITCCLRRILFEKMSKKCCPTSKKIKR